MVAQLPGDRSEFRERKSSLVQKERIEEKVASPRFLEVFFEPSQEMGLRKPPNQRGTDPAVWVNDIE
jgi:hypothetical protein